MIIYEFLFRMRGANTHNKRKYSIIKEHSCARVSRNSNEFFFSCVSRSATLWQDIVMIEIKSYVYVDDSVNTKNKAS